MDALGMIETWGTLASIEASDVMLKTSDVTLLGKERVHGGLIMVSVVGDVAAVKAAVDAGKAAVENLGGELLYGTHVIPRPDSQLSGFYKKKKKDLPSEAEKEEVQEETPVNDEIQVEEAPETPTEEEKVTPTLEEAIASKDREAIRAALEYMTMADLAKFYKEDQGKEIDIKRIRKRDLIDLILDHITKD